MGDPETEPPSGHDYPGCSSCVGDLPAAASQPSGRAFALAVKAAFVVLTVLGFATLWGAIAADMGASLLVVFNGLRLMRESGL